MAALVSVEAERVPAKDSAYAAWCSQGLKVLGGKPVLQGAKKHLKDLAVS